MSSARLILVDEPWEHVRRIRLHRPEKLNALNQALLRELCAALQEAAADERVRAVVLTGSGAAFCAGADIQEFRASLHGRVPDVYE
ncbi:MAG: enoyl-CoA hydratase/isomerase family protein, partial [Limnochordales bacterium]